MSKSIINDNIVPVKNTGQASGDTYGEKGIEQGDDPKVPASYPKPNPMDSKTVK